jgi:hypothetical protein
MTPLVPFRGETEKVGKEVLGAIPGPTTTADAATLEEALPPIKTWGNQAVLALLHGQRQIDADGVMVGVSRQALDETLRLVGELTGALNFIMAFYEPGQRYLDTNAWTQAEAGGWRVLAKAKGEPQ